MSKAYVVVAIGYQYDDERYNRPDESGSGRPVKVHRDKSFADVEAEYRNAMYFKEHLADGDSLSSYAYEWRELTSLRQADVEKKFADAGINITVAFEDDLYDVNIPADLTDSQYQVIAQVFDKLKFFEVVAVESEL